MTTKDQSTRADTKELWGVSFKVVPQGLAEDEVVAFVSRLMDKSGPTAQQRHSSLIVLAEQTVIEADQLAERIKEQARQETEADTAGMIAEAERAAREQSERIIRSAEEEAARRSSDTTVAAEQQARDLLAKAHSDAQQTIQAAKERAHTIEGEAKVEAEFKVRKVTSSMAEEVRAQVMQIFDRLLPTLDESFSKRN